MKQQQEQRTQNEVRFTKEALIKSGRYGGRGDIISAVLKDGREYTHDEAEQAIERFLKGEVK